MMIGNGSDGSGHRRLVGKQAMGKQAVNTVISKDEMIMTPFPPAVIIWY